MELASWYGSIGLIAPTIVLSARIMNHEAATSISTLAVCRPLTGSGPRFLQIPSGVATPWDVQGLSPITIPVLPRP